MSEQDDRQIGSNKAGARGAPYHPFYAASYAVVVGIDSYQHVQLKPLGKAEEDAQEVAAVLSAQPYNFQVNLLLGEQATKRSITRLLNKVTKVSQPDDRIIFYFAGHGYIHPDIRGFDAGYLACADTDPEDPFDGLEYDQVTKLTRFARAKHIAFIFDACFSGTVLGLRSASTLSPAVEEYLLHPAYQVLTAGAVEVVSDARSMTGELVKVLRQGIPGQPTPLTFSQLGQHIHEVIHNRSKGKQTPVDGFLEGSSKGQMVMFTPSAIDMLPEELRLGLSDTNHMMRRFAIAEAEKYLVDPLYAEKVHAVLDQMQYDDDDREVRRRAGEALRNALAVEVQKGEAANLEQAGGSTTPPPSNSETRRKTSPNQAGRDPVLDIIPPPFEWCDIPAGVVFLEKDAGGFDVNPFKLAKYPITYSQFQVFINASDGYKNDDWWQGLAKRETTPGKQRWKIANHPRENVSWYDAVAFCRWLSNKLSYEVRLPTEWEWQWAAQGVDGRQYPWGNEYIQGYANCDEIESGIEGGVYLEKTTPVDNYPQGASPFEVMDMAGNVFEWCLNTYENPGNMDTSSDALRVLRGGSWIDEDGFVRSFDRYRGDPKARFVILGFRCARSP